MHSIGIYETGCTYGTSCENKHKRPSTEPPENDVVTAAGNAKPVSSMATGATRVSSMATGTFPEANGGEYVVNELTASEISQGFKLVPTKTQHWLKNNKIWLQPEDEDTSLCQNCEEGHSHITPCNDGGQHSLLGQQIDSNNLFNWVSYATQKQASQDVQSNSVLATGTRVGSPPFFVVDRRARRRAQDARFCFSIKESNAKDANSFAFLYDSD